MRKPDACTQRGAAGPGSSGCIPLRGWNLRHIAASHEADVADKKHKVCLGDLLLHELRRMLLLVRDAMSSVSPLRVSFRLKVGEALSFAKELHLRKECFNYILTSNLADYVGLSALLDAFNPLLDVKPWSSLATEFMNFSKNFQPRIENTTFRTVLPKNVTDTTADLMICGRALAFCPSFPSSQWSIDDMLEAFLLRERLWMLSQGESSKGAPAVAAAMTVKADLQQALPAMTQQAAMWTPETCREMKAQLGPLLEEATRFRWGLCRRKRNVCIPPSLQRSPGVRVLESGGAVLGVGSGRVLELQLSLGQRCGACKKARCCSPACQKAAWSLHKVFCKGMLHCT